MAFEEMMNDPAIGGGMPPQGPPQMGGPPQGPQMGMPPQGMNQPGGPNPEEVMEKMILLRDILEQQKLEIDTRTGVKSESAKIAMMPDMKGPTGMTLPPPPPMPPMGGMAGMPGMPPMGPQGPPMPPMGGPPMGPIA